jgi:hypothetical protein
MSSPNTTQLQFSLPDIISMVPAGVLSLTYYLKKRYDLSKYVKYFKEIGLLILCTFFSLFYIYNGINSQSILQNNMLVGGSLTYGLMNMILSDNYVLPSTSFDSYINFMLS